MSGRVRSTSSGAVVPVCISWCPRGDTVHTHTVLGVPMSDQSVSGLATEISIRVVDPSPFAHGLAVLNRGVVDGRRGGLITWKIPERGCRRRPKADSGKRLRIDPLVIVRLRRRPGRCCLGCGLGAGCCRLRGARRRVVPILSECRPDGREHAGQRRHRGGAPAAGGLASRAWCCSAPPSPWPGCPRHRVPGRSGT